VIDPKPASPYDARASGTRLLRCPDGRSAFKVYFLDIVGRAESERYEWDRCAATRDGFLAGLPRVADGVGFVTAFPHVAKVFRFGPHAETVLDVRGLRTPDLSEYPLARGDGTFEFACLAEALIAADECAAWASAAEVAEYLSQWSRFASGQIVDPGKLGRYWQSPSCASG
jgi:hypothetical protein